MEIVLLKNIYKSYQLGTTELVVLKDINLRIEEGEYVSIMGPSGSGKSTMLNLLGCLDKPTSGKYMLSQADVSQLDDDELSRIRGTRIGFVFQSYNLIAHLNIIENIEVPMYYRGESEAKSKARAKHLAEIMGLGDRLKHKPSELSGGQQQRIAIARALANDPLLILADEPTGNLDSESSEEIMRILEELHNRGKTLLVITHEKDIAQRASRTVHLLDGYIERIESNIYTHPR